MAWRFSQLDVPRNHRLEDLLLEKRPDFLRHLDSQVGPLVVHRQQDAVDIECRIERAPDSSHGADELRETFERKVFAMERDENGIGSHETVEREQPQGWGAIQKDVVVRRFDAGQKNPEAFFAMAERHQLDFGPCQMAIGGQQVETVDRGLDDKWGDVNLGCRGCQGVVQRLAFRFRSTLPNTAREVGLGVDVDEKRPLSLTGQGGPEVDGRRGFADASLLVDDGYGS